MANRFCLQICIAALVALSSASASAAPLGHWARGDGNAKVRIEPCGPSLCAINTWIRDRSKGENVGDKLVMSVKPAGNGRLEGTAFDPQRDRSYGISITYSNDHMSTQGCLLKVLCKTVTWTRIP